MENQTVEWKESWRDEHLKTICGFANAKGGVMEIGRNDKGEIVGTPDIVRLLEELPNKIRNLLGILADVDLRVTEGKEYVVIGIKPYPTPIAYHGRYYYRSGSTTQELIGSALEEFLLRKQGKTWDSVGLPHSFTSELEKEAFRFFRIKAIDNARLTKEDLEIVDIELLKNLNLLDEMQYRRAAVLLFTRRPDQWIPGAFVKIGFFDNDAEIRYQDELYGSLLLLPDKIIDTLYQKYFKGYISYRGIQRIETFLVDRYALREAVLNALVHKDYSTGVPIQIRVYDDRISIFNTGGLPEGWTIEKLMSQHDSLPRNPLIANVFYRAGLIETWGRGISKMISANSEYGKPEPEFECSASGFRVLFRDSTKAMRNADEGIVNNIANDIVESIVIKRELSNAQAKIIELMRDNPKITAKVIASEIGIAPRNVQIHIQTLKALGWVERIGSAKGGRWVVKEVQ